MLSVIICSIEPEKAEEVKANIDKTSGIPHEFIVIDNREKQWPITKAYNEGAKMAKYPYLLFIHEDVFFQREGWGRIILGKLAEKDCGVIGYAGTRVMWNSYSGWFQTYEWQLLMLYQGGKGETSILSSSGVELEHPFGEAVCLDGLAQFVRKDVWEEYRYDDVNLKGFHCYDIDFTLRICAGGKYKNYVCGVPEAIVEHRSHGNLNQAWYDDTIRMHDTCWKGLLPLKVDSYEIELKEALREAERIDHYFLKKMTKGGFKGQGHVLRRFIFKYPMTGKHLGHCIEDSFRCLVHILKKHN
ncbi:MAG: glycosyltransferase [Bacteroidales bacterium]|nr:glycosyltransferase [Bacteroidales bacterium]MDY6171116.1 glycosyltransferase [Candidatus Cryptobacteroides sp.]